MMLTITNMTVHIQTAITEEQFSRILAVNEPIFKELLKMSQALTDLQTAETAQAAAMDKAVDTMKAAAGVISDLAARIGSAGTDSTALARITADLQQHGSALAGAATALADAMAATKATDTATGGTADSGADTGNSTVTGTGDTSGALPEGQARPDAPRPV